MIGIRNAINYSFKSKFIIEVISLVETVVLRQGLLYLMLAGLKLTI